MSKEEENDYIGQLILHWGQYNLGVWLLFNSKIGKFLECCCLRKVNEACEIEIMYLFNPEYRGN
ncbi:Ribosomal-protein-alanine acetyltransferase [Bacillus cereus]|uniref:Ribosomal-protein-alanine acetyltransferase n=1 Tax=Bacillus cereus TaxID=1396 RepID=A0A161TEM9_BACCE|nr:Ribosomal-protein-alanine acetyltransferase [Bacillus cereus]